MTEQEERYFEELIQDRIDSAKTLDKPSMRGVKRSVVEKYSDQAHFIYELLQNADDAGATAVRFVLRSDSLLFAHNGTRHFSVSNPATEEEDSQNGTLGDINAITSIAQSNKTEASIGKFGVGFKAVFQYTATPEIYDPGVRFRIRRFLVPEAIPEDHPDREAEETLFVFPFDHAERTPEDAYTDISDKLRALSYPILFLSNLKQIDYRYDAANGTYQKNPDKSLRFGDTDAQLLSLTQTVGERIANERLWLFTRTDGIGHSYSVGFFLDGEGHLKPVSKPAFCFFPTKETTNLRFIFHAPFLLTDSREGIRAGISHNKQMVQLLAQLAADSLVYLRDIGKSGSVRLIDDHILYMIPTEKNNFPSVENGDQISFLPFYTAIHNKFMSEELLPTIDGYVSKENAYWADVPPLAKLFSDFQLASLTKNPRAHWVFVSFGRAETRRGSENEYVDSIIKTWIDEKAIFNGKRSSYVLGRELLVREIDAAFIEAQSVEWLHRFYKWLNAGRADSRVDASRQKPYFLNQDKKAVPAFDAQKHLILFLPTEGNAQDYNTVYSELLKSEETVSFFKKIGIREPFLKDEIYTRILPKYRSGTSVVSDTDFRKIFRYYRECPNEETLKYLDEVRKCAFLHCFTVSGETSFEKSDVLYWPSELLQRYFSAKPSTRFVDLDKYKQLVGKKHEKDIADFLSSLGVHKEARLCWHDIPIQEAQARKLPREHSSTRPSWKEPEIDGCRELLAEIENEQDVKKSVILWDELIQLVHSECTAFRNLDTVLTGKYEYFYYTAHVVNFPSTIVTTLRKSKWLMNQYGKFSSALDMSIGSLSKHYQVDCDEAVELVRFLEIQDKLQEEADENSNLTEKQRQEIAYGELCKNAGYTLEEVQQLIEKDQQKKRSKQKKNLSAAKSVIGDISERIEKGSFAKKPIDTMEETDADEYSLPPVDYGKRIERAKEKSQREIEEIAREEELQQQADSAEKYTFAWFKALLELELLNRGEDDRGSREISISFGKVEREANTERTLILRYPSRYIPQYMEELTDISLVLDMEIETHRATIEAISVHSYTIRVKLKSGAEIDGVDLSKVREARITARNPAFLLEALKEQFFHLPLDDGYDLQQNLCENIAFVFGPPGTGKTTHLANHVLIPKMRGAEDLKILVLTPTNKAADVLTAKIMDSMGTDTSYQNWLIRFGTTNDESIERRGVYRDKTFDIRTFRRNITVTTVARFPYDYFMIEDHNTGETKRLHLRELSWDYIVFDEASMIALADIVYPLYKKTPRQFIIAGDPFQIEPITSAAQWKDENIYTMTGLTESHSFQNPKTKPHEYLVTRLTTQYRSIPAIGELFSKLTYNGILAHDRKAESQRKLNLDGVLNIETLNLIKFPVEKYESIYRPKKIGTSPYQIYSALFAFEFVRFLANQIAGKNPNERFSIGVITPYKAQGDLIDKLLASVTLPDQIEVSTGTIHGFQGDECDVILAVFNPPPSIFSSGHNAAAGQIFLNRKNIINVSVSRARDYLFVLMPDDNTENIRKLSLVKRVEALIKDSGQWREFASPELEEIMFGSSVYLEENSFSTSHQNVNVYSLPEKRYEIRSEDTALDVQIHNTVRGENYISHKSKGENAP